MLNKTKINRNFRTFDQFISYHFNGLSAHTLYQSLLETFPSSFVSGISNYVYVVLYEIYIDRNITETHVNTFNTLRSRINGNNPTEKNILEIITEEAYCLEFGYFASNLEWLKNNALDWYVKHIISLNTFKRIAAL